MKVNPKLYITSPTHYLIRPAHLWGLLVAIFFAGFFSACQRNPPVSPEQVDDARRAFCQALELIPDTSPELQAAREACRTGAELEKVVRECRPYLDRTLPSQP